MTYSSLTSGIRAESEGQNTAMQNSKQRGLSNPLFPLTCLTAGTKSAPCVMLVFGITVTHLFVHMIVILVCTTALSVCVVCNYTGTCTDHSMLTSMTALLPSWLNNSRSLNVFMSSMRISSFHSSSVGSWLIKKWLNS